MSRKAGLLDPPGRKNKGFSGIFRFLPIFQPFSGSCEKGPGTASEPARKKLPARLDRVPAHRRLRRTKSTECVTCCAPLRKSPHVHGALCADFIFTSCSERRENLPWSSGPAAAPRVLTRQSGRV